MRLPNPSVLRSPIVANMLIGLYESDFKASPCFGINWEDHLHGDL